MHVKKLQQDLITFGKKQNSILALWKQKAHNSHELAVQLLTKANETTALARITALQLKRLEGVAIATQNLNTAELKPRGAIGQVKLCIIDQPRPARAL